MSFIFFLKETKELFLGELLCEPNISPNFEDTLLFFILLIFLFLYPTLNKFCLLILFIFESSLGTITPFLLVSKSYLNINLSRFLLSHVNGGLYIFL